MISRIRLDDFSSCLLQRFQERTFADLKQNIKYMHVSDPQWKSWVEVSEQSDFPIQNIPFGVFQHSSEKNRICSAIGDFVVDLFALFELGFLKVEGLEMAHLENKHLNDFIQLGKEITHHVRVEIAKILLDSDPYNARRIRDKFLLPMHEIQMSLPVRIGDYTDFYSSREHATNVGTMFRDPNNALLPNWQHMPVGYHGRSSSIVVSGTPIKRPKGQQIPPDSNTPVFGPSKLMDFELEMGFVVGRSTALGDRVSTDQAESYIFGLILFNDWSARDIQKWEYVPLGPFLGKNFASTLSPWIVTLEALEPFRVAGPEQDPEVLPYLKFSGMKSFDINLEVAIQLPDGREKRVCRSNFKYLYWNMCQQLAHHTVNGCNIQVGDLCASGTISGPEIDSYGSMLEISWKGTRPIDMPDGSQRKFILDEDQVIMRGFALKDGVRVGFGTAKGRVLPAD